jgi:hypothetical protein
MKVLPLLRSDAGDLFELFAEGVDFSFSTGC